MLIHNHHLKHCNAVILYGTLSDSLEVTEIENKLIAKFNCRVFKHFSDDKLYSMKHACFLKSSYEIDNLSMFSTCIVVDIAHINLIDLVQRLVTASDILTFIKGSGNGWNKLTIDPCIFYANSLTINRACEYINFRHLEFNDYLKMLYIQTKCPRPLNTGMFVRIE